MTVKVFLELIEVKAKTASLFPFLLGLAYSYYNYKHVALAPMLVYLIAMLLFNMAVDVLDNYSDFKKAKEGHDYKYKTNIIGRENLALEKVRNLIIVLITVSAMLGIGLTFFVGWPLLIMGGYCYFIGIFYSFGPRPLSSLPVGEVVSGLTMGFMITLICVYLNNYTTFLFSGKELGRIFLISLPNSCWIANLMLANNTCDLEEDELNARYTLVHYIGRKNALWLFIFLNIVAYGAIIYTVIIGIAPLFTLLSYLSLIPVIPQIRRYLKVQIKQQTFPCAIKILAIGSLVYIVTYSIGVWLNF